MNDILNPYIAGAPVVQSSMFFGREDVFSWIERSLAGRYVDHILVLHGQRRVGKTSVLKQIPNYLPEKYIQVFFDLQGRTNTTLDRFLWWLAREINRTLSQALEVDVPRPNREAFAEDPEYLISYFLPGLNSILGDKVLLLTFDEFDTLDQSDIQADFAKPLIGILHRLIEIENINFIFSIGSSGDKLENMQASYTEFFKSALYRKISFLTRYDCQRLITKPVEGIVNYEKKAVDRIFSITSGHPYFTQLMCYELFSMCQNTGKWDIGLMEVESILDDVIERGTVNLKFVWDEANDLEKWVLAGLAHLDGNADASNLGKLLDSQHVRFSETDLNSAIIHLQDKDVLTSENQFVVSLMDLWLQVNRPLERVREELVEVNPIANRYIEIGDEYQDQGKTDQAIESYQQALAVDSGNLKARSSIAKIYLGTGAYQLAAEAFELALQIDDEDVAVQAGYCQANLALGNEARKNEQADEAIRYYQKILMVNPVHHNARIQLAHIYQVQAEAFLSKGEDEEALSKLNRAVELIPDDDELVARYQAVLEEKKAKVIASWLKEYERAGKNQRWDEAVDAIAEALRIAPDDRDLQETLATAEESRHTFELESWQQKAEKAAEEQEWEIAIQSWEAYLALNPEDPLEAENELLNAKKYHQIAGDYEQAQDLMKKRRYEKAIQLLQGIIAQDPTYKSTSRLLSEAVKAHIPAPIIKRPFIYISMALVLIVFAGIFFWPQISSWFSTVFEQNRPADMLNTMLTDVVDIPIEEVSSVETTTITVVPTEDPEKILQPTLDHIAMVSPDFVEDFSTPQEYWLSTVPKDPPNGGFTIINRISDGVFRLVDELSEETSYELTPYLPDKSLPDYVLQFDFIPQEFNYGTQLKIFFRDYQFRIMNDGSWVLFSDIYNNVDDLEGNTTWFNMSQPYQFQVIAYGNHVAVTMNEKIIAYLEDEAITIKGPGIGLSSYKPFQVEFDNIKLWYLDEPSVVGSPSFVEPILAYIAQVSPDFEDDFSSVNAEWGSFESGGSMVSVAQSVSDDVLNLYGSDDGESRFPLTNLFQAKDFVIEFEYQELSSNEYNNSLTAIGLHIRSSNAADAYHRIGFHPYSGSWRIVKKDDSQGIFDEIDIGGIPQADKHKVRVIAQDDQFAVYLQDKLISTFQDADLTGTGNHLYFRGTQAFHGAIDNVKFWNLDGVNFDQAFVATPEQESANSQETSTPEPTESNQQNTPTTEPQLPDLLYKKQVFNSRITSLAWSDERETRNLVAVAGSEDQVVILNGVTGRETRDPVRSQSQVVSVEWNPDGSGDRLAIGDVDGLISMYRKVQYPGSPEGPVLHDSLVGIGEISELSFGDIEEDWHTGNYLAASTSTGTIAIWINEGTLVWKMQIEQGPVESLDWNLWNHQILTVSENEGVQVWDAASGSRLQWLQYVSTSAAWSPDGRFITLEDHTTGPSAVVVIKSGAEKARLDLSNVVNKIAWSPDGKRIAAAGKDGTVWLVNGLDDDGQIHSLEILSIYEQDAEVTDLTWSANSDVILTGDVDGNIWAWQVH